MASMASAADEKKEAKDSKEHKEHAEPGKDPMVAHIAPLSGSEFEIAFLSMMIHHHEGGAKMAKMVPEKAKSEELKKMAARMETDQQKEIEQMTGWLKEWHKKTPAEHQMPPEHMKMMEKDMAELEAAKGEEFDKLFAVKMAHHHMGAIEMSKLALHKAEHKEARELAKTIISTQTAERKKLEAMNKK